MEKQVVGGILWKAVAFLGLWNVQLPEALVDRHHFQAEESVAMLLRKIIEG